MLFVDFDEDFQYEWTLLLSGILFFTAMYMRYRNAEARHSYETETVANISNLIAEDEFIAHRLGLEKSRMEGANNTTLDGENVSPVYEDSVNKLTVDSGVLDALEENSAMTDFVKDKIKKYSK